MNAPETDPTAPDPAAVFAIARSLWSALHAPDGETAPPDAAPTADERMRTVMDVAEAFETWACEHVIFDEVDDVWPYLLEDRFGDAFPRLFGWEALDRFGPSHCLQLALLWNLPLRGTAARPLPVDVTIPHPMPGAAFSALRLQTIRIAADDRECEPWTADTFRDLAPGESIVFGLYGVSSDGRLEHIADRGSWEAAVELVRGLWPGAEVEARSEKC